MKFTEIADISSKSSPEDSKLEFFNFITQRNLGVAVGSLGLIRPGDAMQEQQLKGNSFYLSPGRHGGAIFSRLDTSVSGAAPNALITKPLTLENDAVIEGVTITLSSESSYGGSGSGISASALITIQAAARVMIRNCTFVQAEGSDAAHISVANGGKAIIVGCVFKGTATTTTPVVDHPAGAATDVQVAFCYNRTGNTLGSAADVTMTGNI